MKETVITRWETFTVSETNKDDYGNLTGKTSDGKVFKVGAKREGLFGFFEAGKAVKVGYAVYMDKEYIAVASQATTETTPSAPQPKIEPPKEVKDLGSKVAETLTRFNAEDVKVRTMTLAYAKDLAVAGIIDVKEIMMKAEAFYLYAVSGKLKEN